MRLIEAQLKDIDIIVEFLSAMASDGGEQAPSIDILRQVVSDTFQSPQSVFYFLYIDDNGRPIGTCHCQSVHNYWRSGKRYYVGGAYITPDFRRQGHFKRMMYALQEWCTAHDGIQLYGHIHEDNVRSCDAFVSAGFKLFDYSIYRHHWGSND